MKCQRVTDPCLHGHRRGADLFELADVRVARCRRGLQRPELLNVVLSDEQQPAAKRREQPLMQADAVRVAFEISELVRKLTTRVRAVDDGRDPTLTRHAAEPLNRKKLAG